MIEWLRSKISLQSTLAFLVLLLIFCIAPAPALPEPLAANFTADPQQGSAQEPVRFTDTSSGDPISWNWDFGDGTRSTLRNPVHTYSYLGAYTVLLNVTNAAGSSVSVHKEIFMADSGTQVPTTVPQEGLPSRQEDTPQSPVEISLILASFPVALVTRGKIRR